MLVCRLQTPFSCNYTQLLYTEPFAIVPQAGQSVIKRLRDDGVRGPQGGASGRGLLPACLPACSTGSEARVPSSSYIALCLLLASL